MPLKRWWDRAHKIVGASSVRGVGVDAAQWLQVASDVADAGGLLHTLWVNREPAGDAAVYGGADLGNGGSALAQFVASHGLPASLDLTLPPLATLILRAD